jgi:hypothetical protein
MVLFGQAQDNKFPSRQRGPIVSFVHLDTYVMGGVALSIEAAGLLVNGSDKES